MCSLGSLSFIHSIVTPFADDSQVYLPCQSPAELQTHMSSCAMDSWLIVAGGRGTDRDERAPLALVFFAFGVHGKEGSLRKRRWS